MITASVSVDVPSLEAGIRFYADAFGYSKVSEPYPGVVVLRAGESEILLLKKASGSAPFQLTDERRHYNRHRTPIHIDFHVDDSKSSLEKAIAAGAKQEQLFEKPGQPSAAFCSDPFGHGFCLIERRER